MTPQMIKVLFYFIVAVIFKESFEFADWKRGKEISSLALMIISFRFIFLICKQWQYLG